MKRTFKSKVDLLLLLPVLLVLLTAEAFMIYEKMIVGIIVVPLIAMFLIYVYIDTSYELIGENTLKIKTAFFFQKEIYIKSIKKVRSVKHRRASPALSSDRLEISYNRYGKISVSPNKKTEFIRELKVLNPRISVEEKD